MTRRLGAGAQKTQGKLGSMLIQLISQRGWRAGGSEGGGGSCACRFSARGRRWQRKNWGMPAPVIVLPSLVISKIRRGRREGGSVAKTRQRCTPPHAHAAILQAALASLKMAARAHAASGLRLACPGGLLSARPLMAGTRGWKYGRPACSPEGKTGSPGHRGDAITGLSVPTGGASGHLSPGHSLPGLRRQVHSAPTAFPQPF